MENQPEQTRRRGMPGWAIGLIIGGGCLFLLMILAIPAAIMFPVFAKAREAARKATCQSNMKQASMALLMYSNDYNGKYPCAPKGVNDDGFETAGYTSSSAGRATTWASAARPYVKSQTEPSIFLCPSDSALRGSATSYYYKHALNLAGKAGLKERDFNYPADQIMLYEREPFHYGGGRLVEGCRVNVMYLDTHLETVHMTEVVPDTEPGYFNHIDPAMPQARKARRPYWDPRYFYDELYTSLPGQPTPPAPVVTPTPAPSGR